MRTLITTASAMLMATSAQAHEGHGLFGAHWHASDAWGFAVLAVLVAVGIWSSRK